MKMDMDYNKIIHICKERIRQLESEPEYTYTSCTIKPRVATLKTEESESSITYQLKGSELAAYSSFIEEHQKTCIKWGNDDCLLHYNAHSCGKLQRIRCQHRRSRGGGTLFPFIQRIRLRCNACSVGNTSCGHKTGFGGSGGKRQSQSIEHSQKKLYLRRRIRNFFCRYVIFSFGYACI